jgi:hypothetical protein
MRLPPSLVVAHALYDRPENTSMIQRDEISKALKPWEILDPPKRISSSLKMILLLLACSSLSFALGSFSFLYAFGIRGISHIELVAVITNLVWSIPFLITLRFIAPEPYLRIGFYSFISPSLIFGIYKSIAIIAA